MNYNNMELNLSVVIIFALLVMGYMYVKEKEQLTNNLYKTIDRLENENMHRQIRIKDLQKYKNDVSKTFSILDKELNQIQNQVEKTSNMYHQNTENNNVSLLTPNILNSLIENMNQDFIMTSSGRPLSSNNIQPNIPQPQSNNTQEPPNTHQSNTQSSNTQSNNTHPNIQPNTQQVNIPETNDQDKENLLYNVPNLPNQYHKLNL